MSDGGEGPPIWLRVVARLVAPEHRDVFIGDLLEEHERFVRPSRGRLAAGVWLWAMAVRGAVVGLAHRAKETTVSGFSDESVGGRGGGHVDRLLQDLRYAVRHLTRSPGFTLVAVLSLALGIGANTAIFSVVNSVLLRRPDYADPSRLVEVYTRSENDPLEFSVTSWATLPDVEAATEVFEGVTGYEMFFGSTPVEGGSEPILGEVVAGNYFDLLGIPMALGRDFLPSEDRVPDRDAVAIVSHAYWERRYGADPGVLGTDIRLNGRPFIVVGVAQKDFAGMTPVLAPEVWVPRMMIDHVAAFGSGGDRLVDRDRRSMFVKARLRPDVNIERAEEALSVVVAGLRSTYPEAYTDLDFDLVPTLDVSVHPVVDRALVPVAGLLMLAVSMVLLIACANLAGFLLARGSDRRKEIAIRLALGGRRGRLIRQLLTETTLLALVGGFTGVTMAYGAVGFLRGFQPPLLVPISLDVVIDGNVLTFALLVSVATGFLFGLLPALQSTKPDVTPTLKDEAAATGGGRDRGRLRGALLVLQVAVSLVLLVTGGLFLRSLVEVQDVDPGFRADNGALARVEFSSSGYDRDGALRAIDEILERALARRELSTVSVATRLPLGASVQTTGVEVPGHTPPDGDDGFSIDLFTVGPKYLETVQVPIVTGRGFGPEDGLDGSPVVIVSESFARRFWPAADPLGRTVRQDRQDVTVIGVARDVKVRTLGEDPRPHIYRPLSQEYLPLVTFVGSGTVSGEAALIGLEETIRAYDPDLLVMSSSTMAKHLDLMLIAPRLAAGLLGAAGTLALVLAAVGLFGTVSYTVSRRTREVGIRMSLGAGAADVVRLMVGGGLRLVVVGAVIGLSLSFGATFAVQRFLYGVSATDPITFVGVPLLLVAVATVAAYIPARRASLVDPVAALRTD